MQGTKIWRELKLRQFYVSGTTVQAICNEHPFRNSDDVFNEINGIVPHFTGNALSLAGQEMEPVIVQKYRERTGDTVATDLPMQAHSLYPHIGVSPDGLVTTRSNFPIEIKFAATRVIVPGVVPSYYSGQLQLTMAVFQQDSMHFVQMDAAGQLDIVLIRAVPRYLEDRLDRINAFINRVESYRAANPGWLEAYYRWDTDS